MAMRRWLRAGAVIYGTGVAATYVYYRYTVTPSSSSSSSSSENLIDSTVPPTETQRQDTFDKNSSHYDKDIDDQEWLSGIDNLRKDLVKHIIQGKKNDSPNDNGVYVLEMGIGTGRNFSPLKQTLQTQPYSIHKASGIGLYTGIDFSVGMLTVAKTRAQSLGYTVIPVPAPYLNHESQVRIPLPALPVLSTVLPPSSSSPTSNSLTRSIPVMLIPYNISNGLPFDDGKFDIIIDTFGLCSYENPVHILREMQRCLKRSSSTSPGGRILLLEHGRSEWEWLSNLLDKSSLNHAHKHGCYWNRNIDEIVQNAGLTVHSKTKKQGGTVSFLIVS